MYSYKRMQGFGILEVLITLGVLTVGILGVTTLQSVVTQQSTENKARTEALQIAESRIEEMRNITGTVATPEEFDTEYPDTSGYASSTTVNGVSTIFTRSESITTTSDVKNVSVQVAWTDPDGQSQSVSLSTRLTYISPRSAGDSALESAASIVDSPTGRARLGEGTLDDEEETVDNGDGTSLYQDGGTELRLVDETGDTRQIVLTLSDACQTNDGICIDFVKVRGRIYIDTTSHNQLDPGEVFVIASDAAYCARHYTASGVITPVRNDTTTVNETATGDYMYFDYTCYLGGGWHGNIGILLADGNGSQDRFCMGDPTAELDGSKPVIAARRVYRGMLYKYQAGSSTLIEDDEGVDQEVEPEADGDVRYYSQGIVDEASLPLDGENTHDFVVGQLSANDTEATSCYTGTTIMTRADSEVDGEPGKLFAGMPTSFYCLNDNLVDDYDTAKFGKKSACPYDPSDPPSTLHVISGNVRLTTTESSENLSLASEMDVHSSDDSISISNCSTATPSWNASGYYQGSYSCDVYDWGPGWNGYLLLTYDASNISCTTSSISWTALTADDSTGTDFDTCSTGSYAAISGTVTATGNRKLTSVTMSDSGTCNLAGNGLSYSCSSPLLQGGATWTGTLTFTRNSGVICGGATYSYSALTSGNYTLNLQIASNAGGC